MSVNPKRAGPISTEEGGACRPRLSRYDRPALDLVELMRAEGGDFIHLASWSIFGCRATQVDYVTGAAKLAQGVEKLELLQEMIDASSSDAVFQNYPELRRILAMWRIGRTPLIGPVLTSASALVAHNRLLSGVTRFIRSVPGKVRWTWRHSRKAAIRTGTRLGLPSRYDMRRALRTGHAPVPPGEPERVAVLYAHLCAAFDSAQEQA